MTVYKGKDAQVYKDGIELGLVSEVKVDISRDLVTYFSINSRETQEIVEGKESITGSLKRFYVNKDLMELVCDSGTLDLFDLNVRVSSDNSNFLNLYLYDCKFTKGSVKIPTGEVLTEDFDFVGKTYSAR